MRATRISVVGLLAVGTLSVLLILGSAKEGAQAGGGTGGDPQIIGLDMVTTGNTATTLGTIDACVSVTHVGGGTTFDVDAFLNDVPTGKDLIGFAYFVNYDPTYLNVTGCRNADTWLLSTTLHSYNVLNLGDFCAPHNTGSMCVVGVDTDDASAEPAGSLGVIERYTLKTVAAGPAYVGLTLSDVIVAEREHYDWWGTEGDQVWDASWSPQYGIIAIDQPCPPDTDGDGLFDPFDNCPDDYNPDQADSEGDGIGDVCDPDDDNDTVADLDDNCPLLANPLQTNSDGDSHGDACDNCPATDNENQADSDDDTVGDACDNCPDHYNPDQQDVDTDGAGDLCDPDTQDSSAVSSDDGSIFLTNETGAITFNGTTADPNRTVTIEEDTAGIGTIKVTINGQNRVRNKFDLISTSLLTGTVTKVTDCPEGISQKDLDKLTVRKTGTGEITPESVTTVPETAPYTQVTVIFEVTDDATFTVLVPADSDFDGVYDQFDLNEDGDFGDAGELDNCPEVPNQDQADGDQEGLGDVCDPCPEDPDCDDDEFSDFEESYSGTDCQDACPDVVGSSGLCPGGSCDGDDCWPPDLNVDRTVNVLDILLYPARGVLLTKLGDPDYDSRFDLNADSKVNVLDILIFPAKDLLLTQCTP